MRAGNSDIYGFLEPQSIQRSGQSQFESESYIKTWMQSSKRDVYLGAYLNGGHWQMVVILPKEHLVFWFCSLYKRPGNYLKEIINSLNQRLLLGGLSSRHFFQYQIMSVSGQKITIMDALQYMKEVQSAFYDNREKFDKFMDVMKDYKFHRIDVGIVVEKMEAILKDHGDLILGFNKFLPKGYEILLLDEGEDGFGNASKYLKKIQILLTNNIVSSPRRKRIDVGIVVEKMEEILKDNGDLILGFNKFLPKGYEILLLDEGKDGFGNASKYLKKIQMYRLESCPQDAQWTQRSPTRPWGFQLWLRASVVLQGARSPPARNRAHKTPSGPEEVQQGPGVSSSRSRLQDTQWTRRSPTGSWSCQALITGLCEFYGVPVAPNKVIRPPTNRAFIKKYYVPRQAQGETPQQHEDGRQRATNALPSPLEFTSAHPQKGAKALLLSTTPLFVTVSQESGGMRSHMTVGSPNSLPFSTGDIPPHMNKEEKTETPSFLSKNTTLEKILLYFNDPSSLEPERLKALRIQWAHYYLRVRDQT
ncbi:Paired amphipathic helix protein Sin3-like 1 [Glycine soja]|uniref:Paired amphipathic helix protein Sin3-like 1 n=1 Tax=Glycine soja TaxID=3848 RepID=A0A445JKN5_GLYSO|nr:Paired amphipathic helix protein Sin3-like 1 [Glycine soja]